MVALALPRSKFSIAGHIKSNLSVNCLNIFFSRDHQELKASRDLKVQAVLKAILVKPESKGIRELLVKQAWTELRVHLVKKVALSLIFFL